MEQNLHIIFVDNLPERVTKGAMFYAFGFHGNVRDVYISRKQRTKANGPFSFVRYDAREGADRAIEIFNGVRWEGKLIRVKEAKYKILAENGGYKAGRRVQEAAEGSCSQKTNNLENNCEDKFNKGVEKETSIRPERRKVEVMTSIKKKEMLNRSIIAESIRPIKFELVVQRFEELSMEYGRLECRDLGPRMCIISFESLDLRDRALQSRFTPEFFEEVRPYECFMWSPSRRIWLELMGLPIHVWSEDTFKRIARGLNGLMVMQHDLTESGASFSVARILIDCYQWKPIQEWIVVESEGVEFEVYVKEFGEEVLSKQAHLDGVSKSYESCSTCRPPKCIDDAIEISTEVEETPMLHTVHQVEGFVPCTDEAHIHGELRLGCPNVEAQIDDEEREEELKTKEICERGGIHFKYSNEEDVLVRLAGKQIIGGKTTKMPKKKLSSSIASVPQNGERKENIRASFGVSDGSDDIPLANLIKKTPKKQKPNTPVKKGKLTKSVQNFGGRNLSAKILRLDSKAKL
ncbi:hypothetical protein PIB30_047650 [Stylosanthes scabra]|uniref:RRM domain-containing protein n=1 Tax=Stylosanthes scabra TaxID=79078 RepID=A0ABU6UJK7_9FABA|nr:hypothetical protein [Stylosanthes scabra]